MWGMAFLPKLPHTFLQAALIAIGKGGSHGASQPHSCMALCAPCKIAEPRFDHFAEGQDHGDWPYL